MTSTARAIAVESDARTRESGSTTRLSPSLLRELPDEQSRVLLCTDLEGFTSIVERLGDTRALSLMRVHNRLLRACLQLHGGTEVTHTGDGILAAFRSVRRALECATAIQHAFRAHNARNAGPVLRVRIGLHVGAPLPEEDRLFGSCVNVTVRVCAAADAERILVTDDVQRLAPETALHGCLRDRGVHALKGLSTKMRLHELTWR
ncbi:MAG: adenylate/guanylate cyclase domain-containing protein [Polyangiales bacterium]